MDRNRVIADDADGLSPSERVVETVAEATATDPLELEPLYDVIDPDALDRLFRPGRGDRPNGGVSSSTWPGARWSSNTRGGSLPPRRTDSLSSGPRPHLPWPAPIPPSAQRSSLTEGRSRRLARIGSAPAQTNGVRFIDGLCFIVLKTVRVAGTTGEAITS